MTTKEETAAYCDRQADCMRDSQQADDHQHEKVWRDRAAELRNPCHATGCGRACVPGQHMCAVHLAMFSRPTQDRILRK